MTTINLDRLYEEKLADARQWLADGQIEDYKTRDQYGEVYIKADKDSGYDLYWSFDLAMKIHHPEESDYHWGMEP